MRKMKLMRFISILLVLLLLNSMVVQADAIKQGEENLAGINEYPLLSQILVDAFRTEQARLIVLDKQGNDVSSLWHNAILSLFYKEKVDEIFNLLKDEKLTLGYEEKSDSSSQIIEPKGSIRQTKVTQLFYQLATSHTYTKEWSMRLTGYIKHSTVTGKIISATAPSVSVESAAFGVAWFPWITNVSSGFKVYPSYVNFWGKYTMMASSGHAGGGVHHNFGTYTINMRGYPSF